MPEPFAVTRAALKEIVADASELSKGAQILDAGGLSNLSRFENRIFAEAKGSGAAPYKVQLTFGEKLPEVKARCSCMAARSRPFCKHACALLSAWASAPQGFVTSEGPPAGAPGDAKKKSVKKGKAETAELLRKGVEQAALFVRELAVTGAASISSARLEQFRNLAEQLRGNRLRRLSAKTLELAQLLEAGAGGSLPTLSYMDLVSDVLLTVRKLEKHLAGEPLEDKHVEELIGKTWTKKDRQPIAGLDLIGYAYMAGETADNFVIRENLFVDAQTGAHYSQKQILPAFLAKRTQPIPDFSGKLLKDAQGSTYPGYAPMRIDLETWPVAAPVSHQALDVLVSRAHPGVDAALAAFQEHRKDVFAPDATSLCIAADALVAEGDRRYLLDRNGRALPLRPSTSLDFELLEALEGAALRAALGRVEFRAGECQLTPMACVVEYKGNLALRLLSAGYADSTGAAEASALSEIRGELADAFVAGLGSLSPRFAEPLAQRLGELGLEKPAAVLLAAAQKADAAEKMDDVVKIYSVLGIAELRTAGSHNFQRDDLAHVPTHPAIHVRKPLSSQEPAQVARAVNAGQMNQFEAALHAANYFANLPVERLLVELWPTWADGSLTPFLVHALEDHGSGAVNAARDALQCRYGNSAALTAIRLLQRIASPEARHALADAVQFTASRKADSPAPQYPGELVVSGSLRTFAALEALERLDPRHVLVERLESARAKLGDLLLMAANPKKDAREKAVLELARHGMRAAIPALRALADDDPVAEVRNAATRALGALCDQQMVPRWVRALDHGNATDRERRAAAEALGMCGDSRGVLALLDLFENGDAPDLVGLAAPHFGAAIAPLVLDVFERKPELAKRQANASLIARLGFNAVAPLMRNRFAAARNAPDYVTRAALYLKLAGAFSSLDKEFAKSVVADADRLIEKEGKALLRTAQRILSPSKKKQKS